MNEDIIQELVGCQWGRLVLTEDDSKPCELRAVQIVVLHEGEDELALKLCARHRDRVLACSTPHE